MTFFHARPLALGISCYLLGITALTMTERYDCVLPLSVGLFVLFAVLTLALMKFGTAKRVLSYPLLLSLSFLLVLLQGLVYTHTQLLPAQALRGTTHLCEAVVEQEFYNGSAILRTEDGVRVYAELSPEEELPLKEGQALRLILKVDGEFSDADHRKKGYGVLATASVSQILSSEAAETSPIDALREFLLSLLSPLKNADLARAVLFGESAQVDPSLKEAMNATRTQHILCVSGLHVSILLLGLRRLLFGLSLSQSKQAWILGGVCLFYTLLLDFAPSVSRAAIMALMSVAAAALRKNNDPLSSLFLACALLSLRDPLVLYDPSFQLSALATLGLLKLYLPLSQRLEAAPFFRKEAPFLVFLAKGILKQLLLSFLLTLSTVGFSLPALLVLNPGINLWAFFSNWILVVLFTPVLMAASLYLLFSLLFLPLPIPLLPELFTRLCDGFLSLFDRAVRALEQSSALLSMADEGTLTAALILSGSLLLLVVLIHDRRVKAAFFVFCLLFPLLFALSALSKHPSSPKVSLWHTQDQTLLAVEHQGKALLYFSQPVTSLSLVENFLQEALSCSPGVVLLPFSDTEETRYRLQSLCPQARWYSPTGEDTAQETPLTGSWEPFSGWELSAQQQEGRLALDLVLDGLCISYRHGYDQALTVYRSLCQREPQLLLVTDSPCLLPSQELSEARILSDESFSYRGKANEKLSENRPLSVYAQKDSQELLLIPWKTKDLLES